MNKYLIYALIFSILLIPVSMFFPQFFIFLKIGNTDYSPLVYLLIFLVLVSCIIYYSIFHLVIFKPKQFQLESNEQKNQKTDNQKIIKIVSFITIFLLMSFTAVVLISSAIMSGAS